MIRLLSGDCRDVLPTLAAGSVQCVVTSPPYYGLRDYGTALWDGGDAGCDHVKAHFKPADYQCGRADNTGMKSCQSWRGGARNLTEPYGDVCGKCGAVRIDRQIGLEATPSEYLATMVAVFREVRRVLRPDGTCWVNLGDSYASSTKGSGGDATTSTLQNDGRREEVRQRGAAAAIDRQRHEPIRIAHGVKPKDLLLMPARLALALQADGWWVRSDIIWHKPNPMPESCTDRPTSAHEHVFLLTKSGAPTGWTHRDLPGSTTPPEPDYRWVHRKTGEERMSDQGDPETWRRINLWRGHDYFYDADAVREEAEYGRRQTDGPMWNGQRASDPRDSRNGGKHTVSGADATAGRNLRNVWTIATHAYPSAHFATFPPELAERCIRAGTSEKGCCVACGAPWRRTQETVRPSSWEARKAAGHPMSGYHAADGAIASRQQVDDNAAGGLGWVAEKRTTGWAPGCKCDADVVPCTILDPFAGAGTSLLVADRLQRDAIGIELNTAYTEMAMERCRQDAPLFTSFPPAEDPEEARMGDLFQDMAAD